MIVRLTQIDGKLPNLALMKLSAFYRARGAEIAFTKQVERDLLEPDYDRVYGSAIFSSSAGRVGTFRDNFRKAVVGGTWDVTNRITVEDELGVDEGEAADYSIYPRFVSSIGFTQRGCRLKCGFCVVPKKEGKPRSVNTIASLWRGEPYPKQLHILDNDFFGQPREQWEARIDEIRSGGFKVCLNQGINIRMITDEAATALASIRYYDDSFRFRRIFTAWDNVGDEERFFRGIDTLEHHGIPAKHVIAYMLVGYDHRETWERVLYRLYKMAARGIFPFPMVYGDRDRTLPLGGYNGNIGNRTLGDLQRWALRKTYQFKPFEEYDKNAKGSKSKDQLSFFEALA
jgi:hypothetical protein